MDSVSFVSVTSIPSQNSHSGKVWCFVSGCKTLMAVVGTTTNNQNKRVTIFSHKTLCTNKRDTTCQRYNWSCSLFNKTLLNSDRLDNFWLSGWLHAPVRVVLGSNHHSVNGLYWTRSSARGRTSEITKKKLFSMPQTFSLLLQLEMCYKITCKTQPFSHFTIFSPKLIEELTLKCSYNVLYYLPYVTYGNVDIRRASLV